MEPLVGGRFAIEREAGAGAMARVYRARDVSTGATIALKVINAVSEHAMRRFAREVGALTELEHPRIVRYIAHGSTASGQAYLAMEWLAGESLDARLERGALDTEQAIAVARGVASALGAAHTRGLVHRDVKPGNIFLVDGDPAQVKLLDFGLARDTLATFGLTNTGDLLGTPLFMAPEQASCELDIDSRCDVYALGAVLYNCLAGRPPLVASNLPGLLAKIVLEEPPELAMVPRPLAQLVARLLAKQRDDRPADGSAAGAAIESAAAGLSQGPSSVATVLPSREQRVVSILLATQVAHDQASLDATLGSQGGAMALADGSTMVVFAGPETPGDLAARAARYALGLRTPAGVVSLATGRALLSGPTPMGEVIDRAATQLGAAPGTVRIDAETTGLIEGRFELATDPHGTLLVGERAGELDPVRTLLGKPTRCIGRDRELAAIEGYFAECISESAARAVIVLADAGVGKSRLANELLRRLGNHSEAPTVLVARCESITATSPFAAAAAALRRAAGIEPSDTPARRTGRLGELLKRDGLREPEAAEFLAELLGIPNTAPSERMRAARENPALMFDHLRMAWVAWLRAACKQRPVLLVIEDLHWADESSALLVDAALGALADERLLVLALARPEVRDRRPWALRRPHELRLDPLTKRASERLVRDALGSLATGEVVSDIVSRAEGNALFLEELVRAAATPNVAALPVGVIGTLQLRFDTLRPESRTVLRVASVYGERFVRVGLVALVPATIDITAALDELVSAELIAQTADGYAFRHALVREAAYALLPDDDRRLAHGLAADFLEREREHDAAVIARHFELGNRFADAARWYTRAAEYDLAHNELSGAIAHARRAQQWTDDAAAAGALDVVIAEAELWLGNLERTRSAALQATIRLPAGTPAWFHAAGLVITAAGQLGDNASVADWLTRIMALDPEGDAIPMYVLALCRASSQLAWGDEADRAREALARADSFGREALGPMALARLEFARAFDYYVDGRVDACCRTFDGVVSLYTRIGAHRDALQARVIGLAMGNFAGLNEDSSSGLIAAIAEAERLDARYVGDWARFEYALSLFMAGDRDAAEAELVKVPEAVKSTPLFRGGCAMMRLWAAFAADDLARIREVLPEALAMPNLNRRYSAAFAAFAAYERLQSGSVPEAIRAARDALVRLRRAPGMIADIQLIGFPVALCTLVRSKADDARRQLDDHMAYVNELAGRFEDPMHRESFSRRLPWHKYLERLRQELG